MLHIRVATYTKSNAEHKDNFPDSGYYAEKNIFKGHPFF